MAHAIEGNIVDPHAREIFQGSITIENGVIVAIKRHSTPNTGFIMPGFVDAHVHIESSMLTPENFGRMVVQRGTVAVVTDPHEIANVMGVEGVDFMIENSKRSPIKIFFTIPSCVPATPFDVSGAVVSSTDVEQMAASGRFVALSEMMNVPGVLSSDEEVVAKLESAKRHGIPMDGHAPLLGGKNLAQYIENGITTDHECVTLKEALEKIELGMKVIIREGSAARNYEALKSLLRTHPNDVMFCTDDSHPDDTLSLGHINKLVSKSIALGFDLFDLLNIASINAIRHYKLDVGELRVGDSADFMVVNSLETFDVEHVYINGVEQIGALCEAASPLDGVINNFKCDKIDVASLRKAVYGSIPVISLVADELITKAERYSPKHATDNLECDSRSDIAKIVYLNRYNDGVPQVAFCQGFNLKRGAFASSVSHDSHNIIAVGCNDRELAEAINAVIAHKGGLSVCCDSERAVLPLPIGGIMSDRCAAAVAADYEKLCQMTKQAGCTLASPFMTLSFMSLVVIPELKIGEKGLFRYSTFGWVDS